MASSVRLYAVLARQAPVAVIFRRGPSKQVQLVRWHTDTDTFFPGQWLKGRIYERRCDLSPSGERLIYFAGKWQNPMQTWTAVSRPPYLTALAFWPKGDAWGGGGLFVGEKQILLDHRPEEMQLADGFRLPRAVTVSPFGTHAGRGEDDPILGERMTRDGWRLTQTGRWLERPGMPALWCEANPRETWEKSSPIVGSRWVLRMILLGLHERDGAWYVTEHAIANERTGQTLSLGRTDWADWDRNGDLLFTRQGKVFRLPVTRGDDAQSAADARLLVDLGSETFRPVEAPEEAKTWSATLRLTA